MKSLIAHVLTLGLVIGTQSVSACCLFPFCPTYSAGYAPWGWGPARAPATYGYGGGYSAVNYSAGYYGYSGGGYVGTCGSNCGVSCNTGCGNVCASRCGTACGSTCGSSCIGTETRKVPEPDNKYDSNNRSRIFGDEDARDDARDDEFGRSDGTDRPRDRWDPTQPRNRGTLGNEGTEPPSSGTGGSGSSFGTGDPDRTTPPPFGTETDPGGFGTDGRFNGRGTGSFDDEFGISPDGSRYRPAPDDAGTPDGEHSAKKPEVTTPIEEPGAATPAGGGNSESGGSAAPGDGSESGAEAAPGDSATTRDFLPPDITQNRSSHADVLTMKRLAGTSNVRHHVSSQISSSQKEDRPVRWISVPMPADQVRL